MSSRKKAEEPDSREPTLFDEAPAPSADAAGPASSCVPLESSESAPAAPKRPRKPRRRKGMLEKDIKSEALALFQEGLEAAEVARELMLPLSAVTAWRREYDEGTLLAKKSALQQGPTLFG